VHLPKILGISVIDHNSKELMHIIIENFFLKMTTISSPISKSTMYLTSNIVQNEVQSSDKENLLMQREYVIYGLIEDPVVDREDRDR
jgi:hypothetical protein